MLKKYLWLSMLAMFVGAGCADIVVGMELSKDRAPSELMAPDNTGGLGAGEDGAVTAMADDLASAEVLLKANGVTSNFGGDFTYVEKNAAGELLIIKETFSSTTRYKSITPVLGRNGDNVLIDCSYVKAVKEGAPIAVGTYCRGKMAATVETIEDALDDRYLLAYSTVAAWLGRTPKVVGCAAPAGMQHGGRYFVRCQRHDGDELTINTDIYVFSNTFEPELRVLGAEFFPNPGQSLATDLVFVRLAPESTHEVIRARMEQAPGGIVE